jgi:hypothetical protein
LPSIIKRILQEGQEGALVKGICAGRTNREMALFNISCNTVKDFVSWRRNITAATAMPTKCNFWRVFRSQSMKTRGSPWDSGFEGVWPPSSLNSNRKNNFLCGVSERDVNRSPHNKMQPLITSSI